MSKSKSRNWSGTMSKGQSKSKGTSRNWSKSGSRCWGRGIGSGAAARTDVVLEHRDVEGGLRHEDAAGLEDEHVDRLHRPDHDVVRVHLRQPPPCTAVCE